MQALLLLASTGASLHVSCGFLARVACTKLRFTIVHDTKTIKKNRNKEIMIKKTTITYRK